MPYNIIASGLTILAWQLRKAKWSITWTISLCWSLLHWCLNVLLLRKVAFWGSPPLTSSITECGKLWPALRTSVTLERMLCQTRLTVQSFQWTPAKNYDMLLLQQCDTEELTRLLFLTMPVTEWTRVCVKLALTLFVCIFVHLLHV